MLHPHTKLVHINDTIGDGVVATRRIPRGSITWVRDKLDQVITPAKFETLGELYQEVVATYSFIDRLGDYVLCWDLARYINHSCEANCLSPGFDLEIAIRDIEAGEELTDEYGSLNLEHDFSCACGKPACRGTIQASDLLELGESWDAKIREAFVDVASVAQPLWPFVAEKDRVTKARKRLVEIPSSRWNHFRRATV